MLVSDWLMPRVTCMWPCLGSDLTARLLQLYPARSIFAYKDLPDIPAVWPQSLILYPMTRSSSLGAHSCVLEPWESLRTNRENRYCSAPDIDINCHQHWIRQQQLPLASCQRLSVSGSWSAQCLRTRLLVLNRIGEREARLWSSKNRPGNTMAGRYNGINENPNNIYVCPNFSQIKAAPVSRSRQHRARLGIGPV